MNYPALQALPDLIFLRSNRECPLCGGLGLVCEAHPDLPWKSGSEFDCQCGAPGMPCKCTEMGAAA
jgi:hypothetical protein